MENYASIRLNITKIVIFRNFFVHYDYERRIKRENVKRLAKAARGRPLKKRKGEEKCIKKGESQLRSR